MILLILLPIYYMLWAVFWFCVVGTILTLYVSTMIIIYTLTGVAVIIRSCFHSQWPRNPPKPVLSRRRRRAGVIPQARWSNRR